MIRRFLLTWMPVPFLGIMVCVVIGVFHGLGPLDLPAAIWVGAWGTVEASVATLSKVSPLLLTGLAVALAYRAGLLNIGCEGQLVLGALAAAAVGVACSRLSTFLALGLPLAAGVIGGGVWALPAVWLRRHRGVHEVLSTLLLNYVAVFLAEVLVLGPLGDGTVLGRTPVIADAAAWSGLGSGWFRELTAAPGVALAVCVLAQIWLTRSVMGYEVRVSGRNSEAALGGGVPVVRRQTTMFLVSGALAGLAGAIEVVSVHHRFYRAFSPGYGFDGITVAFLANTTPGWLWLSGLLLASLRSADKWLQLSLGVSPGIIWVIQAVLLLAVACSARARSR